MQITNWAQYHDCPGGISVDVLGQHPCLSVGACTGFLLGQL